MDMTRSNFLAHVRRAADGSWQMHPLEEHLEAVGRLAGHHAAQFGSADWAQLAGLWHDLGKYATEFQRRIKSVSGYDPDAHLEGSVGPFRHWLIDSVIPQPPYGCPHRDPAWAIPWLQWAA